MTLHFILALLHVLTIVIDWHRHDFLVREHEVDALQFHHDLGIVAEVGMNITVDVLLISQNGIVSAMKSRSPMQINQIDHATDLKNPRTCLLE